MNVARQLFNLQEVDQELASKEQAYASLSARIGESQKVADARNRLDSEKQQLEEITRSQHSVEWEIEDIAGKLVKFEAELYSGKTTSPKELTGLQQEIESLKTKREKLEDQVLEIMESTEQFNGSISDLKDKLKQYESEWEEEQKDLTAELKELAAAISGLKEKRISMAAEFEPQVITVYDELKKQRGTSVARVEQGICRGCRISLPVSELQRVRGGSLVRCSSCGRILFLA